MVPTTEALITVYFETTSPEGVLFFVGDAAADYLALVLVKGSLRLYGQLGTGLATLTVGSNLGNGESQRVDVQFVNGVLAVAVNELPPRVVQVARTSGGAIPTLELAGTAMVLGSAPTFAGLAMPGLSGCVTSAEINSLDIFAGVGVASATQVGACEAV